MCLQRLCCGHTPDLFQICILRNITIIINMTSFSLIMFVCICSLSFLMSYNRTQGSCLETLHYRDLKGFTDFARFWNAFILLPPDAFLIRSFRKDIGLLVFGLLVLQEVEISLTNVRFEMSNLVVIRKTYAVILRMNNHSWTPPKYSCACSFSILDPADRTSYGDPSCQAGSPTVFFFFLAYHMRWVVGVRASPP